MRSARNVVRIAAIGDLHYSKNAVAGSLQPLFGQINDHADILVLCGDLTDYGLPEEARALAREMSVVKIPVVAVLGNHDFESSQQGEIRTILADTGVAFLDGDSTEILGIGFAGVKGFAGGFGRRALGPWGEDIVKSFVREAVDEALKLESALARLRNDKRIASSTTRPSRTRSKASRSKSTRSSDAAVSKSHSAATRSRRSSTATRITVSLKDEPRRACRSSTCRCH